MGGQHATNGHSQWTIGSCCTPQQADEVVLLPVEVVAVGADGSPIRERELGAKKSRRHRKRRKDKDQEGRRESVNRESGKRGQQNLPEALSRYLDQNPDRSMVNVDDLIAVHDSAMEEKAMASRDSGFSQTSVISDEESVSPRSPKSGEITHAISSSTIGSDEYRADFTGRWIMKSFEGNADRFMSELGMNWATRRLALGVKMGVNHTFKYITHDGDKLDINARDPRGTQALQQVRLGAGKRMTVSGDNKPMSSDARWGMNGESLLLDWYDDNKLYTHEVWELGENDELNIVSTTPKGGTLKMIFARQPGSPQSRPST